MIDSIIELLKDKDILILGFGREGKTTYNFIRKYLPEMRITVMDEREFELDDPLVTKVVDKITENFLKVFDLVFKSPGISFKDFDTKRINITSQLEMLLSVNSKNVIGITGTKGKSTTSTLIYEILQAQGIDSFLVGNIGVPIFERIEEFKNDSKIVIECSSHQLEFVKHSPHISILLNLFPEHLDHYNSIDDYYMAKKNILKYQDNDDLGIIQLDNESYLGNLNSKILVVDRDIKEIDGYIEASGEKLYNTMDKRMLLGVHNLHNIKYVLGVCKYLELEMSKVVETINNFKGLPHRIEFVRELNGVKYYNDSIATIPESAINCIKAIGDVETLIIGGLDRGIDYSILIEYINNSDIKNIICLPDTGHEISKSLNKECYLVNTMEDVVKKSFEVTKSGSCVLSPAASSYGFYKNFEDRGNQFRELVKSL